MIISSSSKIASLEMLCKSDGCVNIYESIITCNKWQGEINMKKILFGIALILFGILCLLFGKFCELDVIGFAGVFIAIFGLFFAIVGYGKE